MILNARPEDAGKRLDAFLHERLAEFSRSRLQTWIKQERVLVDGNRLRASYILRGGENISVTPAALPLLKAEPEELPLRILYEDADVIVIDKAAGMVVHAGAGHRSGTLVNALLHRFGTLSQVGGDLRPGIVHRLDRETSGVLVVARTDQAHRALAEQFHDRTVEKIYLSLVHGRMRQRQGRLDSPIARDPVRRTRMTAQLRSGRTALTEYRVRRRAWVFQFSRSPPRNRPHSSNSRAFGQHSSSRSGRPSLWRSRENRWPAVARPLLPTRAPVAVRVALQRSADRY